MSGNKFVRKIYVDICRNDPVDIRCGGAPVLGFDYTVDAALHKEALKTIKEELERQGVKPMGIHSTGRYKVLASKKTWTLLGIKRNIRKEFKDWLLSEYKRGSYV